jgi:hypothetical protein
MRFSELETLGDKLYFTIDDVARLLGLDPASARENFKILVEAMRSG